VRRSKTDRTDAKALLEADRNEEIHAVSVKTIEHQSIAALHRMRSTWLATRTSRINTVRGVLREFGLVIPVGAQHVVPQVRNLLASSHDVPDVLRTSLSQACDEIRALETQMRAVERQLAVLARDRDDLKWLQTIPRIGVLTATALVALVGDTRRFDSSRECARFLGLTPKEDSSGSRRRRGAISKQGDIYVRRLLIHGASRSWSARMAPVRRQRSSCGRERSRSAGSQRGGRGGRQPTRPDRLGGLDPSATVRRRLSTDANDTVDPHGSPGGLQRATDDGAPVGPARGEADNSGGPQRLCKRLAPRARISMMARSS
jgi:transposase